MNTLLIARRDLAAYLHGVSGYVIIAAVLFIDGLLFNAFALGQGAQYSHEVLENFFYFCSGTTMIASVLLTMRSFAEERASGTLLLLDTSPVNDWQVVMGKYFAAMAMLTVLTLLTLYLPALIFVNGKVSVGHIAVGYLGLLLLGSATTAIGLFASSLFRSQVAAAIVSGVTVALLLLCWLISDITDPPFADVLAYAALYDKHFQPFQTGRLLTSGVVYYISVTFGFLLLSTRVLDGRRWR